MREVCARYVTHTHTHTLTDVIYFFSLSGLQFRLFTRHPVTNEQLERKIEVCQEWTLSDTIKEAHKVRQHTPLLPLSLSLSLPSSLLP